MDDKLKEAIAAVRTGDKLTAQQQLTALLDEDPQHVQGWYLLSLLVESPQKQAAYLSKTLSLNPQHEKAKEQLAVLKATGRLAPTATIKAQDQQPLDVVAQSETDALPDWLREESGEQTAAIVSEEPTQDTAVPSDTLPDWLKEPVNLEGSDTPPAKVMEEGPTIVGKTAAPATKSDKIVADLKQTLDKPTKKAVKGARAPKQNTRTLNIVLGLLVILAIVVMILLAYLLLS